ARMLRRRGPPVIQPYRDLLKLIRKEAVIADNASWLFRASPYMIFAATWVAAALVPTFATGLTFGWVGDLIVITALIGSARFFQALAGMDIGTVFCGICSSREVLLASLGEPALIIIDANENARIRVDNPATHLKLTMVHEAMVLEYPGRHLAMNELPAAVK